MTRDALQRLLAPITADEFVARYWMQRSLHIPGGADKVAGVFSSAAFEAAVAAAARRPDAARRGFDIRAGAERAIAPAQIAGEFAAGHTICVSAIELGHPPLAALAAELKAQLGFPGRVAVNAYLSPRGSGYSFVHFDARIALTLQIEGRKRWRYAERSSLPWPAHNVRIAPDGSLDWHQPPSPWELRAGLPGKLELTEVVLAPGDVLCLPAGTFHAAESVDDRSLSININFNYSGFFELVHGYLAAQLAAHAGWREPPPAPTATELASGELPARVAAFVSARLAELRAELDRLEPRAGLPAALVWHAAMHAPVAARPPLERELAPTDMLDVATVSLLRPDPPNGRAYLVSGAGAFELVGDALLPFARALCVQRRFVAGDALAWSGGTPYRWDELVPILHGLVRQRVLAVVAP